MKTRAIVSWGVGWGIGLLLLLGAIATSFATGVSWLAYPLVAAVGVAAFGVPMFLGARRSGSPLPLVEGAVWVLGFCLASGAIANDVRQSTALAPPGTLNINTTETIRERQAYFDRWHMSPEQGGRFTFTLTVLGAFGLGSGILSGLAAVLRRRGAGGGSVAIAFGAATCAAFFGALVILVIGGYVLVPLTVAGLPREAKWMGLPFGVFASGFLPGFGFGAVLEWTRATLLAPTVRSDAGPPV